MTALITFRTKVKTMFDMAGNELYHYVDVPKLTTSHCDMNAFRQHPRYGGLANSVLFTSVLARIRSDLLDGKKYLRLDNLPNHVTVDKSGFLAIVVIKV